VSAKEEQIRKAAEGLRRAVHESGGGDAVRRTEAARERAIRDLARQQEEKKN
jgi:hypothetical protein